MVQPLGSISSFARHWWNSCTCPFTDFPAFSNRTFLFLSRSDSDGKSIKQSRTPASHRAGHFPALINDDCDWKKRLPVPNQTLSPPFKSVGPGLHSSCLTAILRHSVSQNSERGKHLWNPTVSLLSVVNNSRGDVLQDKLPRRAVR